MWSDAAREAAAAARKKGAHSTTHEGKNGNRKIAKKAANDHKQSVIGGGIKGAGVGAVIGGAIGAAALNQYGGARIGAKLGAIAGAKTGAVVGAAYRFAKNRSKK